MSNGIDLNNAPEQTRGPIPPDSLVVVRLHLRPPQEGRAGSAPGLTASQSSSMQYLNCELEVLAGSFKGNKIWNNYNVEGAQTDGQRKAVDISMRSLRAMVEAARGILPQDQSPQAAQQRRLQSWMELDNIIFPVQVDCEISQPDRNNKRYVNNTIKKIITPGHEAYDSLMKGGEVITTNPLRRRNHIFGFVVHNHTRKTMVYSIHVSHQKHRKFPLCIYKAIFNHGFSMSYLQPLLHMILQGLLRHTTNLFKFFIHIHYLH